MPSAGFFYEGGDQVNEKHLDALWNGVNNFEEEVLAAFNDIDSNSDGIVDEADFADNAGDADTVDGQDYSDIQNWVNNNADVPNADYADNADQLDGNDASAFATSSEIDSDISTHASVSDAHHSKPTSTTSSGGESFWTLPFGIYAEVSSSPTDVTGIPLNSTGNWQAESFGDRLVLGSQLPFDEVEWFDTNGEFGVPYEVKLKDENDNTLETQTFTYNSTSPKTLTFNQSGHVVEFIQNTDSTGTSPRIEWAKVNATATSNHTHGLQ